MSHAAGCNRHTNFMDTQTSQSATAAQTAALAPAPCSAFRASVEALAHELECDPNYNFAGLSDATGETFAAKLARIRQASDVMEQWLRLCEMGLQDVVPEWVKPTIEDLWEKTDAVCSPNVQSEPRGSKL